LGEKLLQKDPKSKPKNALTLVSSPESLQDLGMRSVLRAQDISVILVEPSHPGNIGAVARAMGNMGVDDLRLVRPKDPLCPEARERAAHAERLLLDAKVFESPEDAVADLQALFGTTARLRSRQCRGCALPELESHVPVDARKIGFMFGRESSGLTNEELALCTMLLHIPTFGEVSSLNLSHAVMVTLYEVSRFGNSTAGASHLATQKDSMNLASVSELEGMKSHLESVLKATGFLHADQETGMMERFSDFFARARPSDLDVRMWRGMLHRVEVTIKK